MKCIQEANEVQSLHFGWRVN